MSDESKSSASAREREVFLSALEKTDPAQRRAFLDGACAGDSTLRRRVDELLREHEEAGSFLQTPAIAGPGDTQLLTVTEKPGDSIGRYKLLQQIGEGGCGVVYMAEQEQPVRRRVALKVIKLGMDTKSVIARFEAERQALAMMDHPNIARVFDAGATETGRPYFVMELVRGIRITEFCDENNLSTEERLQLFIQVCQAIQHAHQKGIIHRDIKPSNILVTLHDGKPVPKVIDFGIAKATEQRLTEKTLFTEFQSFIGTPAYTSPEQAEMSGLDIDTRSDIYSLGVLLYELLTGQTPFDPHRLFSSGLHEMRRIIREEEPARPSTRLNTLGMAEATALTRSRRKGIPALVESVRGDLDWIVMKCLEKDRTRRYDTANGVGMDIQRYLDDEPVLARPPSNLYRLGKLYRRHRGMVAATTGIAAALIIGTGVSIWQAVRATEAKGEAVASQKEEKLQRKKADDQRAIAERERASARINEYVADINLAHQSLKDGNYGRAYELLRKHRPASGNADLRGFEWRYLWQLCQGDEHVSLPNQEGPVQSVAYSPDGELLAIGVRDIVNIWSTRTRSLITSLGRGVSAPTFASDGKTLIAGARGGIRLWRTADWTELSSPLPGFGIGPGRESGRGDGPGRGPRGDNPGFDGQGPGSRGGPGFGPGRGRGPGPEMGSGFGRGGFERASLAVSRDGSRLAILSRDGVSVREASTGKELRAMSGATAPLVFSPDGKTLATDSEAGLTLWPVEGTGPGVVLADSTNVFVRGGGPGFMVDRVLAFSPDGKSLVAARNTLSHRGVFVLSIWDVDSGTETVMPEDREHIEHTGIITCLAFSPDGRTLATASMDHSIRLWDFPARRKLDVLQGHLNEVMTVAFSPDGKTLASGARGGGVKLWPIPQLRSEDILAVAWRPLGFSPDGRMLAALTGTNSLLFLNLATAVVEQQIPLESRPRFEGPRYRGPEGSAVAVSADLSTLAQGLDEGRVKLWDTATGDARILTIPERQTELLALSPNGKMLITGGRGQLRCWSLQRDTNYVLTTETMRVLFSPDGATLAVFPPSFSGPQRGAPPQSPGSTQTTNVVQLWDLATGSLRTNLVTEAQLMIPNAGAAFSPDSRTLATVNFDIIRLWDVSSGALLGAFTGHKQAVQAVTFSPDGQSLATASDDSTLKLWNVATGQELLTLRRLGGSMSDLMFSPDGQLLVGAGGFRAQAQGLRFYRAPRLSEIDREHLRESAEP